MRPPPCRRYFTRPTTRPVVEKVGRPRACRDGSRMRGNWYGPRLAWWAYVRAPSWPGRDGARRTCRYRPVACGLRGRGEVERWERAHGGAVPAGRCGAGGGCRGKGTAAGGANVRCRNGRRPAISWNGLRSSPPRKWVRRFAECAEWAVGSELEWAESECGVPAGRRGLPGGAGCAKPVGARAAVGGRSAPALLSWPPRRPVAGFREPTATALSDVGSVGTFVPTGFLVAEGAVQAVFSPSVRGGGGSRESVRGARG